MNDFIFTPSTGLLDTAAFPTNPQTEAAARQQFMTLFNQLKDFLNSDVKTELAAMMAQGTMITPTLINGWINSDTSTFNGAQYWKDPFGYVHIRGMIQGGAAQTIPFWLPDGYKPLKDVSTVILSNRSDMVATVRIRKDGATIIDFINTITYVNFGELIFKAGV